MKLAGDYIDGAFVTADGEALVSHNPAKDSSIVIETASVGVA